MLALFVCLQLSIDNNIDVNTTRWLFLEKSFKKDEIQSVSLFQYITLDHFKVYKTNIGMMVFINDKIYNLSELKSLD